ncbi:P-loop containing nucleoside triphosphate hydrolase protein, partial [Chytridium lagenaria]
LGSSSTGTFSSVSSFSTTASAFFAFDDIFFLVSQLNAQRPKDHNLSPANLIMAESSSNADGWGKPDTSAAPSGSWGAPPLVTNLQSPTSPAGWGAPPKVTDAKKGWGDTSPDFKPDIESVTAGVGNMLSKAASNDNVVESENASAADVNEVIAEVPVKKHSNLLDDNDNAVEIKLSDLQVEANQALYSGVTTFEDLPLEDNLKKGLYAMGFQRPSKIQEKALPLLLANPPRNMIGQSQSGTGKTAAFALTMLSRVNPDVPTTQAICLAPARELARQIMDVVREMGKFTSITTAFAIKDSIERGAKVNAHIVIGTPGTVLELIKRRQLDSKDVRIFVCDEADNMLDQQGLGDQSIRVKTMMPKSCQIVLFSATFTDVVREYAVRFAPNANTISLKQEELSVDGIRQLYMDCKNENHKIEVLTTIYGLLTIGQSIVFVRRKDKAEQVAREMTADGHEVILLHGSLDPNERDRAMDDFRDGKKKVLITTNVLARGIDILQVNLVVNFDMRWIKQSARS